MGLLDRIRSKPAPAAPSTTGMRALDDSLIMALMDGGGMLRVKAASEGPYTDFSAFSTPYNGNWTLEDKQAYAQAYCACVWAFRALNVRATKIAELLGRGQVLDDQGVVVEDNVLDGALRAAFRLYAQNVWEDYEFQKSLYGEVYVEKVSAVIGTARLPSTMRVLNTQAVDPIIIAGQVTGYRYVGAGGGVTLQPEDVVFDRYRNPGDDVRGMSLLAPALMAAQVDSAVVLFQRGHMKNNARPGLIFTPKTGSLTEVDEDKLKASLASLRGGQNAGRVLFMPVPFDVTTATPPEMSDLGELTDEVKRRVCSAIGVPAALVDYTDMAFQLSPEQMRNFYELTLIPEAQHVARVVDAHILPWLARGRQLHFDLPLADIRADMEDASVRVTTQVQKLQAGAITMNEFRQALGDTAVVGGDVFMVPTGYTLVRRAELLSAPETVSAANAPPAPTFPAFTPPALQAVSADEPAMPTPDEEFKTWRRFSVRYGARKAQRFVCKALDEEREAAVRTELARLPADADRDAIRAAFDSARRKDAASAAGPFDTPADVLEYWRDYDELQSFIGDTWLTTYMQAALNKLDGAATEADVQRALESLHDELSAAWIGTLDAPGPMLALTLAGMGAGEAVLRRGSAGNPARPVSKAADVADLAIDWTMLSQEALRFIQNYLPTLIRRVDDTTLEAVRAAIEAWIQTGGPQSDLEKALRGIFSDARRAALIAQTESTRAYAEGTLQRYRMADVKTVRYRTVSDGHVCSICGPHHNKTAGIDEGFKDFRGRLSMPPLHPGCRCYVVAEV